MTTPSLDWPLNPENTHSGHRLEPEISVVFPGKPWATSRVLWAQNGSCQWHNSSKQWEEMSASLASHSPSHEWEKSRFLSWTLWGGWNLPGGRSDMALATETVSNRSLTRGQVKKYNVAPTYLDVCRCLDVWCSIQMVPPERISRVDPLKKEIVRFYTCKVFFPSEICGSKESRLWVNGLITFIAFIRPWSSVLRDWSCR